MFDKILPFLLPSPFLYEEKCQKHNVFHISVKTLVFVAVAFFPYEGKYKKHYVFSIVPGRLLDLEIPGTIS